MESEMSTPHKATQWRTVEQPRRKSRDSTRMDGKFLGFSKEVIEPQWEYLDTTTGGTWVKYDEVSQKEIEKCFLAGQSEVVLKQGIFAGDTVHIKTNGPEKKTSTGNREVRRIAYVNRRNAISAEHDTPPPEEDSGSEDPTLNTMSPFQPLSLATSMPVLSTPTESFHHTMTEPRVASPTTRATTRTHMRTSSSDNSPVVPRMRTNMKGWVGRKAVVYENLETEESEREDEMEKGEETERGEETETDEELETEKLETPEKSDTPEKLDKLEKREKTGKSEKREKTDKKHLSKMMPAICRLCKKKVPTFEIVSLGFFLQTVC